MNKEKFDSFLYFVEDAFKRTSLEMLDIKFSRTEDTEASEEETVCVVIGIVGINRGRIILRASKKISEKMAEIINGEALKDLDELYLCMAEFCNIFCGNAVTYLNNKYRGTEMRLTPPAVFEGERLKISTPNIKSVIINFASSDGSVYIDIGLEGVQ